MEQQCGFFAYPGITPQIYQPIEIALAKSIKVTGWKEMDIVGHFIRSKILENIESSSFLIADITHLNFNVVYEIGYAIGLSKKVLIVRNQGIKDELLTIQDVGIFDTLGYKEYQNSEELYSIILNAENHKNLYIAGKLNQQTPLYLLDTKIKSDWSRRIVSRIKKAGFNYKSFDPAESARLSAHEAIENVSKSMGVVVTILNPLSKDSSIHNIRAAFIAGLSNGMKKPTCILQDGIQPTPIDYRDFVKVCNHPDEVDDHIAEFAAQVTDMLQSDIPIVIQQGESLLSKVDLGASSAENEMRTLRNYYLKTDQYLKSSRGEVNLVVGRKGSGKSAIFLQIRDKNRSSSKNVVLDLKPDGYQLIKFKELIAKFLANGTYHHTIMAFWEYLLLIEICHKVLETDKIIHTRSNELYEPYQELQKQYYSCDFVAEGDFSERMEKLIDIISSEYHKTHGNNLDIVLSQPEITKLIHQHDVIKIQSLLVRYLKNKDYVWILFDNIDKGWATNGITDTDIIIVRTLIDAAKKIERQFSKGSVEVKSIIFLRNDVYELLIKGTSDRGKDASVLLDWCDPDLLKELIRLRLSISLDNQNIKFDDAWRMICCSHISGESTPQYLIERSLMRPRFLLNLINQCKSFAINLNHDKIEVRDIEKGLLAYSTDLLTDISYEINDVFGLSEELLYCFIQSESQISENRLEQILLQKVDSEKISKILELLLWYGFLGIKSNSDEPKYIYQMNYNMHLLAALKKTDHDYCYVIHPAFRPALLIEK